MKHLNTINWLSIIVIQVQAKLHKNLFISTCSSHWNQNIVEVCEKKVYGYSWGLSLNIWPLAPQDTSAWTLKWGFCAYAIGRPSQWFWGTWETGHLFQGNRGTKAKFWRETGEQRQYWGTGNIRKQIFDFLGTGEQANLFQGKREKVPPWEGFNRYWNFMHLSFNCRPAYFRIYR